MLSISSDRKKRQNAQNIYFSLGGNAQVELIESNGSTASPCTHELCSSTRRSLVTLLGKRRLYGMLPLSVTCEMFICAALRSYTNNDENVQSSRDNLKLSY